MTAEIVQMDGTKYVGTVNEVLKEVMDAEAKDYTKLFMILLDDTGSGRMIRHRMTDEELNIELDTIKSFLVNRRIG